MASLPRGICSVCGMSVPVRRNGAAREHNYQGGSRSVAGLCKGAGKPVKSTTPADVASAIAGAVAREGALNTLAGVAGKRRRRARRIVIVAADAEGRPRRVLRDIHPGPDPFRRTTQQIDYAKLRPRKS